MLVAMWQTPEVQNDKMKWNLQNQSFPHRYRGEPNLRKVQNQTKKNSTRAQLSVRIQQLLKV